MQMPGEKTFVRGPFNWIDVALLTIMAAIMIFSVLSGTLMGD